MQKKALLLLLVISTPLQAAVHRWVDAEGEIHFSDKPPIQQHSEKIKLDFKAPRHDPHTAARLERQRRILEYNQQDREEQKQLQTNKEQKAKRLQQQCDLDKKRLLLMERTSRLFIQHEDGSRTYKSEDDRQAIKRQLQNTITENCS